VKLLAMVNSDGKSRPVVDDPPGIRTELVELRRRIFARNPARRIVTDLLTADAAATALHDGADGIFIDSFADYGIEAIRALTDRPVVGAGEASLRHATAALDSFAIVTVWPESLGFLYDERLRSVPQAARICTGVRHVRPESELDRVGGSDSVRARMVRHDRDIVEELVDACEQMVAETGAAGVLLGCTCMAPVADELARRCDFPVLDPARLGHDEALRQVSDQGTAPSGHPEPILGEVVDAWLSAHPEHVGDECEVCAIVPASQST
jgi:Asp/Glu/hydantoin racemase